MAGRSRNDHLAHSYGPDRNDAGKLDGGERDCYRVDFRRDCRNNLPRGVPYHYQRGQERRTLAVDHGSGTLIGERINTGHHIRYTNWQ